MTRPILCAGSIFWLLLVIAIAPVSAQDGAAAYAQNCAACHDAGVDRAPSRRGTAGDDHQRVLAALESGATVRWQAQLRGRAAGDRAVRHRQVSVKGVDMTPAAVHVRRRRQLTPRGEASGQLG